MNHIAEGWRVSTVGLLSVFGVLLLFYAILNVLMALFPHREEE
ncbi:MAG: hypothetical protein WBK10_01205 [Bacillota bacterium]|jgi:hypothetical protein